MLSNGISNVIDLLSYNPREPLMFNSGFFLYFFVFVVLGFNFVKGKKDWRSLYLMVVSFFFYYKSSGLSLFILVYVTMSDYLIALGMSKTEDDRRRKYLLLLSLVTNLGMLCYFKYTNFFLGSLAELFSRPFNPFDIVLPVGISFFTFQSMSYTIDVYKRKINPLNRYIDYAFYVSFFPQLVAGPIVRAKDFIPQISLPTVVTEANFGRALFLIMSGLFKKVVISDYISVNFVDRVFDAPELYSSFENLMGMYGYALQIYCDFSGYSDMAIGIALLFGFHFNINFDSPYQSSSITEFWRRWHISLSGWLRDYLYISLGGNRKGTLRTYVNLMITMLLGGLWHGASMVFVIWGAWHGILLAIDKVRIQYIRLEPQNRWMSRILKVLGVVFTFHLVCIGWVFFRSSNLADALKMLQQIAQGINLSLLPQFILAYKPVVFLVAMGYALHFVPKKYENRISSILAEQPLYVKAIIVSLLLFLLVQVRSSDILPFIYFQF